MNKISVLRVIALNYYRQITVQISHLRRLPEYDESEDFLIYCIGRASVFSPRNAIFPNKQEYVNF